MKKNEAQFFSDTSLKENNLRELKYRKSKTNTVEKYNFSSDSFLKNKNKTTSNFNLYRNSLIMKNNSKDISNKKKELIKSFFNSISIRKTELLNSSQIDINFLRRILSNNIKNKSNSYDIQNSTSIINLLNKAQIKKIKADFIKYKFLLGQKNYYKRLFEQDDFSFSTYYSRKINPYASKNPKRFYINIDKLKKVFLRQDKQNINEIKDLSENLSISLPKNFNNTHSKKNNFKINNCTSIKIKKYNSPNILKFSNELLIEDKNIIRSKNNIIEKSKENIKNKNQKENKEYKEINTSKKPEKIIDEHYEEYLKGISSTDRYKSKSETKNANKKNPRFLIKNLKSLKKETSLSDKSELSQYKNRLNKYNYSNVIIKNNKKLLELKKIISNRRKKLDDNNKNISKSMVIETLVFGKKIALAKGTLK